MPAAILGSTLHVLDRFGPVEPTLLQGPVRSALMKFGDGLLVEESTTNLVPNPSFELSTNLWSGSNGGTITRIVGGGHTGSAYARCTVDSATNAQVVTAPSLDVTAGVTYTASARVRGTGQMTFAIFERDAADALVGVSTSATITLDPKRWQTATVTRAFAAGNTKARVVVNGVNGAATVEVDSVQLEQKPYATSYCDGSLATAWDAPGNLLATATQSMEDGTTGGFAVNANVTVANSAAFAYAGTRSLLATVLATASASWTNSNARTPVTVGETYTGSIYVRASAARQVRCDIVWYDQAGAPVGAAIVGTATAATVGAFQRYAVTGIAPAGAVSAALRPVSTDAQAGDTFHSDAARFETGTGAASYRWTGAEHASASVRTGGRVQAAVPAPPAAAITIAAWVRLPSATRPSSRVFLWVGTDGQNGFYFEQGASATTITASKAVGNVFVAAGNSIASAVAGSLVFVALTFDGATLRGYVSVDGGALVSSATATATVPPNPTVAELACYAGGSSPSSTPVEQVLIYDGVLTTQEITALAFAGDETRYGHDPRIVLSAATGTVRGSSRTGTASGAGSYRTARTLAASVEPISPTGASPDDDLATHKATVPAGSGVGQGQFVSFSNPDAGPGTSIFQVQRTFTTGGALDELYLSRVA